MNIRTNKIFLIFTLFYLYFVIAFFESSRGNFIPLFLEEFKINNSQMSLILSLGTLGSTVGSLLGGQFSHKFGHRSVYISGAIICAAAVLIAPFTYSVFLLGLFNLLFGIGRAALTVSIDSSVPFLFVGFETIMMNINHFMYGLGSFFGQLSYGKLLNIGFGWRDIYLYVFILFAFAVILTFFAKTSFKHESAGENKNVQYKNLVIYLLIIAVTSQILSESILSTWFISYLRNVYKYNIADAARLASILMLLFTFGRLVGGFIGNKIGNIKTLKFFLITFIILLLTGLQLKENGIMLIACSGFFLSIGFPSMMLLINSLYGQNSSTVMGFVVMASNFSFMILFNLTGVINDFIGIRATFYAAAFSTLISLIFIYMINKKIEISIEK